MNYLVFLSHSFGVKEVLTHLLSQNCNRIVHLWGDGCVFKRRVTTKSIVLILLR